MFQSIFSCSMKLTSLTRRPLTTLSLAFPKNLTQADNINVIPGIAGSGTFVKQNAAYYIPLRPKKDALPVGKETLRVLEIPSFCEFEYS